MRNQLKQRLIGLLFGVLFFASNVQADLKGGIKIDGTKVKQVLTGTIYLKDGIRRMDMQQRGQTMSTLIDMKNKKVTVLMHSQKVAMENAFDPARHGPDCDSSDYLACLKSKGFTRVAGETVNGHPCDVYEANQVVSGKKHHNKIWKPTDLKEAVVVRSMSVADDGGTVNVNITNLTQQTLDASLFTVPAGYRNMGDLLKGMVKPESQ